MHRPRPQAPIERVFTSPLLFTSLTVLLLGLWTWPRRWALSGSPILYACILLGERRGHRILPFVNLWAIFSTLNLSYAVCSTSWLLYGVFAAGTYMAIGLVCLFQFEVVGNFARRRLRAILKSLHFIDDKIALFDIPALEIDTDVDGLLVVRGATLSLSSLSLEVHGVEVGIKLTDDMELSIYCETVQVRLLRGIWVGDCFANLKGGKYEMTFGELDDSTRDEDGDAVFVEGTQLLKAATFRSDTRTFDGAEKMTAVMTDGRPPKSMSARLGLAGIKAMSPDDDKAAGRYQERLSFIKSTDAIREARTHVERINRQSSDLDRTFENDDPNAVRAAICSHLHQKPSVPHPPSKSIKVTTLQSLAAPRVKAFLHRLPMLLRLLLSPLSYFHPVHISSLTATASGAWIDSLLLSKVFQSYHNIDSQLAALKARLSAWLSDANFVVELTGIAGRAQVPFIPTYDINCRLDLDDVMAYRSLPKQVDLKQVVRLGGADASFAIPSFLLPHHEHLIPAVPSAQDKADLQQGVLQADGKPKEVQAEHELKQAHRDETNVKMSVHARLPACFDQELLDFIAALVKATKIVEMEKEADPDDDDEDEEGDGKRKAVRAFISDVGGNMRDGFKRRVVDGMINDRWIAKLIGKVTKKLETARGEAGYSGDIPVPLKPYRTGMMEVEGEKLLR
jgi:hypothetical protein